MLDPRSLAAEPTDEEEYDEDPEEMERKFQEAEMLNQQLKQMLAAAEQDERRQMAQMRRQAAPQRGARGSSGSFGIPPRAPPPGPRMLGVAKNGGWGGLTHTQGRANEIDKDNQILVQKLSSIAIKPTMNTRATIPFRANPGKTTVAINRRKKDDQIARENAALAKRLNSVKPTSTLSNKATAQHAKNHSANLRNLNAGKQPMHPMGAGGGGRGNGMMARARSANASRTAVLPALGAPPPGISFNRPFE